MSEPVPASASLTSRWQTLVKMDSERATHLLELVYYSLLYAGVGMIAGSALDQLFPPLNSKIETQHLIWEIVGQTIVIVVCVFYIRKLVQLVPFFLNLSSNYELGSATEYQGEFVLGLIFISIQTSFLSKVAMLRDRLVAQFSSK